MWYAGSWQSATLVVEMSITSRARGKFNSHLTQVLVEMLSPSRYGRYARSEPCSASTERAPKMQKSNESRVSVAYFHRTHLRNISTLFIPTERHQVVDIINEYEFHGEGTTAMSNAKVVLIILLLCLPDPACNVVLLNISHDGVLPSYQSALNRSKAKHRGARGILVSLVKDSPRTCTHE